MEKMNRAELTESSYPNCINFKEIDVTFGCNAGCLYCSLAKSNSNTTSLRIDHLLDENTLPNGIYLSPNSDPFDPIASESSHKIIEYFLPKGVSILINTKNAIPNKTIKLLAKYKENVIPQISIARMDQELSDYLEPNTAKVSKRIDTIRKLAEVGLPVRALMTPLFPGIDDVPPKIEELVKNVKNAGAKGLKSSYVVLRDDGNIQDNQILKKIKKHPQLSNSLKLMTERMDIQIGHGNIFPIENRIKTYALLNKICENYNLKFLACTVLDPALKDIITNDFHSCRSVWTYQKDFIKIS